MIVTLNWLMLLLAIFAGTGLLFSRDWRWSLGLLAVQYLSVFWMVQAHWPISLAATKLVTGWMACAILGIAQLNAREEEYRKYLAAGKIISHIRCRDGFGSHLCIVLTGGSLVGVEPAGRLGRSLLIGLGLLHLGLHPIPFR